MSVQQMRKYVSDAYPGDRWKAKVKKMSDNQIIAVYHRIISNRG